MMAGVKQSLQYRLIVWLASCVLVFGIAGGLISFFSAFHDAYAFQDDQLRQVASLLNANDVAIASGKAFSGNLKDSDSRLIVWTLDGAMLPRDLPDGLQTVRVHKKSWRLFVRTLDSGLRIAVGQRTEARDELARHSGVRTAIPFAVLLMVLVALIVVAVRKTLAPVARLSAELDRRNENDLGALDASHAPTEIAPFVVSINRLLERLARAMNAQRRFIADAAHELRSPMTALLLQTENLQRVADNPEALSRLAKLKAGLQRSRNLLEQLLTMARVQASPMPSDNRPAPPPALPDVLRHVLEDVFPLADAKHIDISFTCDVGADAPGARLRATAADATILFRNLLDNAIRYTPEGGSIHVRAAFAPADAGPPGSRRHAIVDIVDNGPGIAPQDRARVFDPFYRAAGLPEIGSGLGLSIVHTIVQRLGGTITLDHAQPDMPHGLHVRVVLPVDGGA